MNSTFNITIINLCKQKNATKPFKLEIDRQMTVKELKKKIMKTAYVNLPYNRIGLSYTTDENSEKKTLTEDEAALYELDNFPESTFLYVKDYGPQISYRLVYIIEYLGPLLIFLLYFIKAFDRLTKTQQFCMVMSSFHYGKRLCESIFLHEFSHNTMPLYNLFKNCAYYWGYYGVICGFCLFREGYTEPTWFPVLRYFFIFLFFSAEVKNLKCHIILKELKTVNKGKKGIPDGEGFELVSCANYFWEIISWFCFSVFSSQIIFFGFTILGFIQMKEWAKKKHMDYIKKFGDKYPKKRKMLIPYFI